MCGSVSVYEKDRKTPTTYADEFLYKIIVSHHMHCLPVNIDSINSSAFEREGFMIAIKQGERRVLRNQLEYYTPAIISGLMFQLQIR